MQKLFLLICLFPILAHAAWSAKALQFADKHIGYFPGPQSLAPADRGALASVWGAGMRTVRFHGDLSNDEQMVKLPKLFKKDVRVFLRVQNHRAPLMVVIPGVFSNGNEDMANEHMHMFSKLGYHVLTLPNCWSRDFAKAHPMYSDDYPSGEARAMTELTRWAIHKIGAKNISKVELIGESLGALTVAVIYARDSQLEHPLFTGGATLTWPPIVLHEAIGQLDSMMTATDQLYENKCHGLIRRLITKWRILRGVYLLHPTRDEVRCAPSIVAQYSFRRELIKLAKVIHVENHDGPPVSKKLTFAKFILSYAPRYSAALKENDHEGSLRYWLDQMAPIAKEKIQIITSQDDFLNDTQAWRQPGLVESPHNQLIIAHWGGHVGLTNTDAYEDLLRIQFGLH